MIPVVSPETMVELEKGCDVEKLMDEVAQFSANFIAHLGHTSCLIISGTGNNGADALLTGCYLIQKGIPCAVYCTGPSKENSLHAKQKSCFISAGGKLLQELPITTYSCCIDGIFGIGFSGQVSDEIKKVIEFLNTQQSPVFSIDIPSGLNAATGEASCAVTADYTLACHLPKLGLFVNHG